jgi:hypothetical protein
MRRPTAAMAIAAAAGQNVGVCQGNFSDSAAVINLSQERLLMDPLTPDEGWWGTWLSMLFNVQAANTTAFIVTPNNIARVIVMDVCKKPIRIRNGFYEYLEFGIGLQPRGCSPTICGPNTMQAFERDTVVTLTDFAGSPQLLRVFITDPADLGKRIVFQGTDNNGATILGTDTQTHAAILGETVFFAQPFATTLNQFSGPLTGILKDPTNGFVQIFMIDPVSGTQTLLSSMAPGETTAQYRKYQIVGLPCNCCPPSASSPTPTTIQVSTQARIDFVPVTSPSDYLTLPNIPAIIEECQAIRFGKMDSPAGAANEQKHHLKAIQLLNGQLDLYESKVNTAIGFSLFGSDTLRPMPR